MFTFKIYVDSVDSSPLLGMIYMLGVVIFCWTDLTNQNSDQIFYSKQQSVFFQTVLVIHFTSRYLLRE